jgi:hypothetical protein
MEQLSTRISFKTRQTVAAKELGRYRMVTGYKSRSHSFTLSGQEFR